MDLRKKSEYLKDNLQYELRNYKMGSWEPDINSPIEAINAMALRLKESGGYQQQSRMIRDKRRSLDRALLYSYQGASVRLSEETRQFRALMNPNKLKQDYDEKIISTGFENEVKVGDVFEWIETGTYWLIYLQELTELAYFRANCRKCSYEISFPDEDGNVKKTYCAIRGPVETQINYIQKHQISVDLPNYSLNILMPKNEDTLKYFKRYSKFYLGGIEPGDTNICWRVEAVDSISMPGILEINAEEYYANETEDDGVTVKSLIVEKIDPNPIQEEEEQYIEGETFIKPKKSFEYTFKGRYREKWKVDPKYPVKITEIGDKTISLTWTSSYSGQFELYYGDYKKTIVVESLF